MTRRHASDGTRSDARPPNPPWRELPRGESETGFLSFYYSDSLSALAVRAVTLAGNNKADPNLETGTYGLFSTCGHGMRASVVRHGDRYLFFVTNRGGERVLAGYYRLRWYAPSVVNGAAPDYALAAAHVHFIDPPIRLAVLRGAASAAQGWFRVYKRVDSDTAAALVDLLERLPDCTADYLREIDRLERFNRFRTGFRYVAWERREPFTWEYASDYLAAAPPTPGAAPEPKRRRRGGTATTSPNGYWVCSECRGRTKNEALLKRCPKCGALGTLEPAPDG